MLNNDSAEMLSEQVVLAYRNKTPLRISAGNSKIFYGRKVEGEALSTTEHSGIIEYRASELVITARSGTKLSDIETALAENNQRLAFEPPIHSEATTLGGCIATGLSGPARPFTGAARDFVLGSTVINGKGEQLKFGGQVMKNVAGYDASRLMVGAQGTLGVLLDVSIKVLPKAESEVTLRFEQDITEAHKKLREWILQGHPVSASCYYDKQLYVRLSSTESTTRNSCNLLGGEISSNDLWDSLRHQKHDFFTTHKNSWRLSVPPSTEMINNELPQLVEWGGALRWVASDNELFEDAKKVGGHASRYPVNTKPHDNIFQPLTPAMLTLQQRLKKSFDPENILNPCRLYPEL